MPCIGWRGDSSGCSLVVIMNIWCRVLQNFSTLSVSNGYVCVTFGTALMGMYVNGYKLVHNLKLGFQILFARPAVSR